MNLNEASEQASTMKELFVPMKELVYHYSIRQRLAVIVANSLAFVLENTAELVDASELSRNSRVKAHDAACEVDGVLRKARELGLERKKTKS